MSTQLRNSFASLQRCSLSIAATVRFRIDNQSAVSDHGLSSLPCRSNNKEDELIDLTVDYVPGSTQKIASLTSGVTLATPS